MKTHFAVSMYEVLPSGVLRLMSDGKSHVLKMCYNDGTKETWSRNPSIENAMENFICMTQRWAS